MQGFGSSPFTTAGASAPGDPKTGGHALTQLRDKLLDIVLREGYLRLEEPIQLRSGEWSHDFIDGKRALADGADLEIACKALMEMLAEAGIDFDAVGGLTLGADQFAHGTAIVGHKKWFVVRKELKGRGTNRLVEGAELNSSVRVLLVDDVVSTGGSIKQAWESVHDTGAQIVAAVTLVDRGEVATKFFADVGVPYLPLLTYHDLGIEPVGHGRDDASAAS
jgi:orotate phosphoribosyltransferase